MKTLVVVFLLGVALNTGKVLSFIFKVGSTYVALVKLQFRVNNADAEVS